MDDVIEMLDWSAADLYAMPRAEAEGLQLAVANKRFHALVDTIPVLRILADRQGVGTIDTLDDLCLILFKHTTLKSYPLSILENGRFDKLTAWLDKLTTHDLSSLDVSHIETIDEWLQWMNDHSPMRISHSTGTSGKLSFFPRSVDEAPRLTKAFFNAFAGVGDEPANELLKAPEDLALLYLGYRHDFLASRIVLEEFIAMTGREDSVVTLFPGEMSADVLSLQGRMRTAEATGRMHELKISPALLARREELLARQAGRGDYVRDLVTRFAKDYGDRRAIVWGLWTSFMEMKAAAEEMGITQLFAPGSLVSGGGGTKGAVLPDDYYEQVCQFMGVDRLTQFYGMTELNGWMRQCPNGHYHIPPYTIPFLLDGESGEPKPRVGRQRGRFAFFDLLATSYWGGCVTGDELGIEWDQPCGCGRGQPYIVAPIQRFVEAGGGDDKISCSGAPKAHDDALNFLAELKEA